MAAKKRAGAAEPKHPPQPVEPKRTRRAALKPSPVEPKPSPVEPPVSKWAKYGKVLDIKKGLPERWTARDVDKSIMGCDLKAAETWFEAERSGRCRKAILRRIACRITRLRRARDHAELLRSVGVKP